MEDPYGFGQKNGDGPGQTKVIGIHNWERVFFIPSKLEAGYILRTD